MSSELGVNKPFSRIFQANGSVRRFSTVQSGSLLWSGRYANSEQVEPVRIAG